DDARYERPLRRVGHERLLAVEQRDLRGLEDVRARVALERLDQEEGLDIAQDGEAERGGCAVERQAGELRHRRGVEASLTEFHRWGRVEGRATAGDAAREGVAVEI